MFNLQTLREQFPALNQKVYGKNLIYLDSAATTLKPQVVIDRMNHFYSFETANVHRGAHHLSDHATNEFESARETIRKFLNASTIEEVIFTKGTTEGINLIAESFGLEFLNENDEIVITELEHHANIIAWQVLVEKKKCVLKYIPVFENGEIDLTNLDQILTDKTKIVSISACSNTTGTFLPIEEIIKKAKAVNAVVVVDAAQFVSQKKIDVQILDVDFLVFSAHKLFGPYGFGVLFGKKRWLDKMPPYQLGGSMISTVDFQKTTYNSLPYKFEAGTPNIEGAIATKTAIDFFSDLNIDDVFKHEQSLLAKAQSEILSLQGVKIFGEAKEKAAILSFNISGAHHSDVGQILDQCGVAVRVGHHCTQPLLKKFGITGTVRASISIYNNENDIDQLIEGVKKAKRMLL